MRTMAIIAGLLVCMVASAAQRCQLVINDVSGVEQWPLIGGLPLAQGVIFDPAHIRVLDGAGQEVSCQVDVATTYRDGSIRWALISMVGSPAAKYLAEFGPDVTRSPVSGIRLTAREGGYLIDTGPAQFLVTPDNLLIERAGLRSTELWAPGQCRAYLIDNQGRQGVCAGPAAQVELKTLKSGPVRVVLRTEGWYVTPDGQRLARGVARMSFFAGSPLVRLSHSIIFTEDTNALWLREYGLTVPLAGSGPAIATFDTDRAFDDTVAPVRVDAGDQAAMLQSDFPHFAETESHFTLTRNGEQVVFGAACGEWVDLTRGATGIAVAVRDFAEQFPKELAARADGMTVRLWPASCGRELDFRSATLVRDYWQSWANLAPGGPEAMARQPNNARCTCKTHELWLLPHTGAADVPTIARQAHAVCRPVLMLAEPSYLCATEALTWPLHPYDPERFPAEERMISDFWDRLMLPYEVFPMTGVIAWGTNPYLRYVKRDGRWYADFYRVSGLVEYGMRRHVWSLFARSLDRKYYEWGTRFNQHAADWEMHHWDAGDRYVGGLAMQNNIHWPFPWGNRSNSLDNGVSGVDVLNWLLEYYMTGDERAQEAALEYAQSLRHHWDLAAARKGSSPFLILRLTTGIYAHTWDEPFRQMAHDLAHQLIDPASPNYLTNNMPYGALYKVDRNASALYDYWWSTGDELAREAFLKALDYEYRFNHVPAPIAYQNAKAYLFTLAWRMTGREEYRRIVNQLVQSGLVVESNTLAEEIGDTLPRELDQLPYRGAHLNMHPTLGMPTALWLIAQATRPISSYPSLSKASEAEPGVALFEKPAGQPLRATIHVMTTQEGDLDLHLLGPDGRDRGPLPSAEQRMETYSPSQFRHLSYQFEVPADQPAGIYRIPFGPVHFQVLHAEPDRVALGAADGFWVGGDGPATGMPVYFQVPPHLDALKLFIGRPLQILAPDGSAVLQASPENTGEVSIPVNGRGGAWAAWSRYPGHVRLLNVPPVVVSGDPARLPHMESLQLAPTPRELPPPERFVPGVIGQALQLRGDERVSFPRGGQRPDGSFQHFPLNEGTVELWFRPNWSSSDLIFRDGQLLQRNLVHAGAISFYYRYGQGPRKDNLYSYLDLLTTGPLGAGNPPVTGHIGGHARLFFRVGQWQHLAATWKLQERERGTEGAFAVFVDGNPIQPTWDYPRTLTGREPYRIGQIAERIFLGACDGSIDELRISDTVRYEGAFAPPTQPFTSDEHTLALLHFDGSQAGIFGADSEILPVE